MKRRIDRSKIWQILSVYLLALIAAIVCGNNHHSSKAVAQTPTNVTTAK